MPGIFGVYSQGRDVKEYLSSMNDVMMLYLHFDQDEQFVDDHFGASRVHLGKIGQKDSPLRGENDCKVWMEGEVYNLAEILLEFNWTATKNNFDSSFSFWLVYAYHEGKLDQFLNRIDGYFCATIYDPIRKKVLLVSDRYGMRMLYWYHQSGLFAWASEVKGLLAIDMVDRSIDEASLNCFMELGYLIGAHTWFEHIHLIKPASILEYDINCNELSHRFYWTWSEIQPCELSFDDAIDALFNVFITSVNRRFDPNERIGISLSGGLDSRAIFAAVNHLYPDHVGYAYTFGIKNCADIRIAREVVSRSKWRHEEFNFDNRNWFAPRKEMIWNTDGMLDMMHMHGGEFLEAVSKNIDINLNGFAGDAVIGGSLTYIYGNQARSSEASLNNVYNNYAKLADFDDPYFDFKNAWPGVYSSRIRRFTSMGTVNGLAMIEHRKPFFDNSVIELAYSIPTCYRASNKVYSAMLKRYFPRYFEDIPWQKTGKPAGAVSRFSDNILYKISQKIFKTSKLLIGGGEINSYTDYSRWMNDPVIYEEFLSLLSKSNSQYQKITSVDWQAKYFDRQLKIGWLDRKKYIFRAATVELYLRRLSQM